MSLKEGLSLLAILAFTNPAFAQHHVAPRGGGRPTAAAPHAGQPHQMTPQQHEHFFQQQMWNEQMMFEEMMRSRGGDYKRQSWTKSSGGGTQALRNDRAQPSTNRQKHASNSAQPGVNQEANKGKDAAASKTRTAEHSSIVRIETRKESDANKRPLATDQSSISLLKTAHLKLSRADQDYAGHRVEAMRHVASALKHLNGSSAFKNSVVSGAGNLPQAESDRLLREAEGHLRLIENMLNTGTESFKDRQNARTSVVQAIRELRIALRIN